MKTVRLWSLLTLLFIVSINALQAGDAPSKALLIAKLKYEVIDRVDSQEIHTLSSNPAEVRIDFRIDTQGKIQVSETDADSQSLDTYIHEQLDDHFYHKALAGKKFVIKVDFKRSS